MAAVFSMFHSKQVISSFCSWVGANSSTVRSVLGLIWPVPHPTNLLQILRSVHCKSSLKPSRSANVVTFYGETSGIHRIEVNSVRGIWFARRRSRCPQADRNHAVVEPFWINPFEVSWTIKTILSINILYLFIIK